MAFLDRSLTNHVLTLTMTSPETRNALTGPEQFDDIVDVCREINDNMAIRAVVLTGEGSAFCAGGNVKDMRDRTGSVVILWIKLTLTVRVSSGFHERFTA